MGGIRGKIGPVLLTAAGGGGVLEGYASPNYRVTVQAGYQGAVDKGCVKDTDKDKIPDETDRCPTEFGTAEFQGCPDRDGDGVVDIDDVCPDVPGLASFKGCPDKDKDGIEDSKDKCPDVPGLKEFAGCPDKDGDGVEDAKDKCPDVAGVAALLGCPDKDKDGIADDDDQCPDVAGKAEFNGCPPPTPSRVKVTKEKIEILEVVLFETGKDKIRPESFGLLDDVAKVLNDYQNIKKVRVEGHTDNAGNPKKNLVLSQGRAKSVMTYLTGKGVAAERLVSEGYGDTKPIADNKTKKGKEANRRVEFNIVGQ
jgi:outer membrane protein OmpA-like peptidoglycan-associated protein